MLSDIRSREGEGGDMQVKGGNKEEDLERIFSFHTPSLLNKINCEMQISYTS